MYLLKKNKKKVSSYYSFAGTLNDNFYWLIMADIYMSKPKLIYRGYTSPLMGNIKRRHLKTRLKKRKKLN